MILANSQLKVNSCTVKKIYRLPPAVSAAVWTVTTMVRVKIKNAVLIENGNLYLHLIVYIEWANKHEIIKDNTI